MPLRESAHTAHDINNQLMCISSVAQMVLMDLHDGVQPPSLEADLKKIVEAAHRSAKLVYQLQQSDAAAVPLPARERL